MAKVGILQIDIAWENAEANIEKVAEMLRGLEANQIDLLVLPELWSCGFTMNHEAWRTYEKAIDYMRKTAKDLDCAILGGLPFKTADGQENRCYLVEPDQERFYTKMKVFKYAGEHKKYQEGAQRRRWGVAGFKLSPFICYDLRFPELPRPMVPETTLISYVACWPKTRTHHWRLLLQARAVENQAYVIGCNRVGRDGAGLDYIGASMIVSPSGEIVLDAGDAEGLHLAEIHPDIVHETRTSFPFLADI